MFHDIQLRGILLAERATPMLWQHVGTAASAVPLSEAGWHLRQCQPVTTEGGKSGVSEAFIWIHTTIPRGYPCCRGLCCFGGIRFLATRRSSLSQRSHWRCYSFQFSAVRGASRTDCRRCVLRGYLGWQTGVKVAHYRPANRTTARA